MIAYEKLQILILFPCKTPNPVESEIFFLPSVPGVFRTCSEISRLSSDVFHAPLGALHNNPPRCGGLLRIAPKGAEENTQSY
jgi:hypothetical protein